MISNGFLKLYKQHKKHKQHLVKKTGKLLDPQLAALVESVQNILFCESKDLCFKFSMFFVVYYVQSVLFEKNHGYEYDLIDYIFRYYIIYNAKM
jgi:hypothetical protein